MISEASNGRFLPNIGILSQLMGKRDSSVDTKGPQGALGNSGDGLAPSTHPGPPLTWEKGGVLVSCCCKKLPHVAA